MEPARREAALDLILSGAAQDLVQGVEVAELNESSDHNDIKFNLCVFGKMPGNSSMAIFVFKRGNFSKMRNPIKKKLKGAIKRVKSVEWLGGSLKTSILEALLEFISQVRKLVQSLGGYQHV